MDRFSNTRSKAPGPGTYSHFDLFSFRLSDNTGLSSPRVAERGRCASDQDSRPNNKDPICYLGRALVDKRTSSGCKAYTAERLGPHG